MSQFKMSQFSMALLALILVVCATPCYALTFNWSFNATGGTSTGLVTGTISGLEEGNNSGTGLTIEVLSSPSGNVLGGGWTFSSATTPGVAFVVTGGVVTFASAVYRRDSNYDSLFFGSDDPSGYIPQLYSSNEADLPNNYTNHALNDHVMSFTAVPNVPLPAALPLFASGLGVMGLLGWRRKRKKAAALASSA
jgi:PEP-CTERM motif